MPAGIRLAIVGKASNVAAPDSTEKRPGDGISRRLFLGLLGAGGLGAAFLNGCQPAADNAGRTISSLQTGLTTTGPGIREPDAGTGKPIPINLIDLVVVPGLGFTPTGFRIGRGMGFYDRFLAQPEFVGLSCGLAFEEQVVPALPVLDHDVPLGMLVTDRGIHRFASNLIQSRS